MAFLIIRPLVFLKPGSPSAITSIVFFPMNSRASRPPVITVFPCEEKKMWLQSFCSPALNTITHKKHNIFNRKQKLIRGNSCLRCFERRSSVTLTFPSHFPPSQIRLLPLRPSHCSLHLQEEKQTQHTLLHKFNKI